MKGLRFLLLLAAVAVAAIPARAADQGDLADYPACTLCGMDRARFAHSRMLIEYDDGAIVPVCSLHCAAINLAGSLNHVPVAIRVADYYSHGLLDSRSAVWVVGGTIPGVMSTRGKWAFADRGQAEKFMAASGGAPGGFANAVQAAYEDMYRDTEFIRDKRNARKAQAP